LAEARVSLCLAGVLHSSSSENGGAGAVQLPTGFDLKMVVGMPLPQHRLAPFVAEPFRFTWKSSAPGMRSSSEAIASGPAMRHPFYKVLDWQERLKKEPGLTKAQIACDEGLSSARMTQMFSLLRLPEEARQCLASLTSPVVIKSFAIRRLMAMAKMPLAYQREAFAEMKTKYVHRDD
jgi:hypothetical protein